jgi:hypothetical protein
MNLLSGTLSWKVQLAPKYLRSLSETKLIRGKSTHRSIKTPKLHQLLQRKPGNLLSRTLLTLNTWNAVLWLSKDLREFSMRRWDWSFKSVSNQWLAKPAATKNSRVVNWYDDSPPHYIIDL